LLFPESSSEPHVIKNVQNKSLNKFFIVVLNLWLLVKY